MSWMSTFGEELRRIRHDAGVSLAGLARQVHYSKGYISKMENDRVRPNEVFAALCDRVFCTDGALVALVPPRPVGRRKSVLLQIHTRTPADILLPARPDIHDLKLAMSLEILDVVTECAAPDVGETTQTLCLVMRLHGLCAGRCVFDLSPVEESSEVDRHVGTEVASGVDLSVT
jgi:transcriptional regulator with XRE-family HTH domain